LNGANGDERVLHCYFGDYYGRSAAGEQSEVEVAVETPSFAAFSVASVSFHIVQ